VKTLASLAMILLLGGCTSIFGLGSQASPLVSAGSMAAGNGDDPLPVNYLICDAQDENCEVYARFGSLQACEQLLLMHESLCDRDNLPGEVLCTPPRPTTLVQARCENADNEEDPGDS